MASASPTPSKKRAFLIGVTGGTASGKTTVCNQIVKSLNVPWVSLISMDAFYRNLTKEELEHAKNYNFDHPDAFDWPLFLETIRTLKTSGEVKIPKYSFVTHQRLPEMELIQGADVVIVEGILTLHNKELRDEFDLKVFVDVDPDIRLARRLKRDIIERGRSVESVLNQYIFTVKPAFDDFIYPTKKYADLIIPGTGDFKVAVELISRHILLELDRMKNGEHKLTQGPSLKEEQVKEEKKGGEEKKEGKKRKQSPTAATTNGKEEVELNTITLENGEGVRDILRKRREASSTAVLEFQTSRLARLLLAQAMNIACDTSAVQTVTTPSGAEFVAPALPQICGVSVDGKEQLLQQILREMHPMTSFLSSNLEQSGMSVDVKKSHVMLLDASEGNNSGKITQLIKGLVAKGISPTQLILVSLNPLQDVIGEWRALFPAVRSVAVYKETISSLKNTSSKL